MLLHYLCCVARPSGDLTGHVYQTELRAKPESGRRNHFGRGGKDVRRNHAMKPPRLVDDTPITSTLLLRAQMLTIRSGFYASTTRELLLFSTQTYPSWPYHSLIFERVGVKPLIYNYLLFLPTKRHASIEFFDFRSQRREEQKGKRQRQQQMVACLSRRTYTAEFKSRCCSRRTSGRRTRRPLPLSRAPTSAGS